MAGILDYYGYEDTQTQLVTLKKQEDYRQSVKDKEQDEKIKQNYEENITQQDEIELNSLINDEQIAQINDLYEKIDNISGGTIADLDMGSWS
jgi:uncharacterized membrane protein YhiD involved in acid resistance